MRNSAKYMKLTALVAVTVIVNIVVLSPGLIGLQLGGSSALETASGLTVLFISLLVMLYGSYSLLLRPVPLIPVQNPATPEEYTAALTRFRRIKLLKSDVSLAISQLERMQKKVHLLTELLRGRFEPMELSYKKFMAVIGEVEKLFYANIRGIVNKLSVVEASQFSDFTNQETQPQLPATLIQARTQLYNEYIGHISGYLRINEEILLKLDQLLLELSLLGSAEVQAAADMPGMKEIEALIRQTKAYKS
ncbi:hypothetical protein [Paenibacillus donghaensis]|uniref:5-bromo-4-chloroindolyl phosphate hydrolysis protein n=1 Tax=Paenibacillus donghaensis TaxID=414771 RepID=A0A2Z2K7R9_9BACL|nr:hypothetical protein [Paenibacillus donghaensis]ASA21184.1 hypothetical protein B9T62_10525 [Paenibacillus donghaensis]